MLSEVIDELESRTTHLKDVTTKGDLEVTKLALQKEIEELKKELKEVELRLQREIERVKASIIKWVVGLLLVQTGVIVSIINLLR